MSVTPPRIAILIDGGFFLHRLPHLVAKKYCQSVEGIVACIRRLCRNHVNALVGVEDARWHRYVYRIFYYDAMPYDGKAHHPIDNRPLDFAKSDIAQQRRQLFDLLRKQRKMALRLGKVNRDHDWAINPALTKKILRSRQWATALAGLDSVADGQAADLQLTAEQVRDLQAMRELWTNLDGSAVRLGLRQKGVDMRIGIDIATLSLKQQADTLILVAGDSDFVPAAKLARREGVEFILDPMWQQVNPDLFEHIDGLRSGLQPPTARKQSNEQSS